MIQVAAFYRFASFEEPAALRLTLLEVAQGLDLRGTILVAHEGLNGTVAGAPEAIAALIRHLETLPGCANLEVKLATTDAQPFGRMLVKHKPEIVTMGQPDLPIAGHTGTYLAPDAWDALIARPDVVVVDTRNDYEVCEGRFGPAIDPKISHFRQFPAWVDEHLDPARDQHVALYCTGGIRCEKATALLRAKGFANVYHLEGGILRYFADKGTASATWNGTCFVFDERRTVDPTLAPVPASPTSVALQQAADPGARPGAPTAASRPPGPGPHPSK